MRRMIDFYNSQLLIDQPSNDSTKIAWGGGLKDDLKRGKKHQFIPQANRTGSYRPFCKQSVYFSSTMNERQYQLPKLFPTPAQPNLAITSSSDGRKDWSALITRELPDLSFVATAQCFSLYTYEPVPEGELPFAAGKAVVVDGYVRRDNITDATLSIYHDLYNDEKISKEDIFFYIYGVLNARTYKETYKADLMKMLPRIPKVKDFWGFSEAGRALAELHLNYETVGPAALTEVRKTAPPADVEGQYDYYRVQKLSWGARKDRTRIVYNTNITLEDIPAAVLDYQVNGKSAIEWILDRYQMTTHKESQITNDPNDYCREVGDPRYIIDLIKRIVTVSLETNKIVASLPPLVIMDE